MTALSSFARRRQLLDTCRSPTRSRCICADVTISSETVTLGSDHAELAGLAMKQAIVGRGVTHLILPNEVQHHPAAVGAAAGGPAGRLASRSALPPADELARAVEMIRQAKRPMIVVGAGCRNRAAGVVALREHLAAPVATTFKAKGLISDSHPLVSGVMGRSGTPVASWCMNESDLQIVFGASFSNHTGIAPYKTIIQIDDDTMSIGRFHGVDVGLLVNVDVTVRAITAELVERGAIAAIDQ